MTGLRRVRVDVEHRSVVQGHADGPEFRRQRPGEALHQADVSAAAQGGHGRPLGERRLQPGHAPAFLVDADPERDVGHQPGRLVRQLGDLPGLGDVPRKEDDAAQAELPGERAQFDRELKAIEPGHQEPADLTTE